MPTPTHSRYATSAWTLFVDRFMTGVIRTGGVMVIAAVFGILVFILWVALPLFQGAAVRPGWTLPATPTAPLAAGIDEWQALPFTLDAAGVLDLRAAPGAAASSARIALDIGSASVASAVWSAVGQRLALGTTAGELVVAELGYGTEFTTATAPGRRTRGAAISRRITAAPAVIGRYAVADRPLLSVSYQQAKSAAMGAAIIAATAPGQAAQISALTFSVRTRLGGAPRLVHEDTIDVTALVGPGAVRVQVDDDAEGILVQTAEELVLLWREESGFSVRQRLRPFADRADARIASADYVFGDVSVIAGHADGTQRRFSLYARPGAPGAPSEARRFHPTGGFDPLPGPRTAFHASIRNKSFAVAHGEQVSLRHSTTQVERWQGSAGLPVTGLIVTPKYDGIVAMAADGRMAQLRLDDPHPEAGLRALFGSVWYEGHAAPRMEWQSTGTDDSEPKYSLSVLIFGTMKATLYTLLFAIPVALLAALYTAEFMHPRFKAVVKPTMELMAALPSVVLGFLAALWLAPLLDDKVPSFLLMLLALPVAGLLLGWGWGALPRSLRRLVPPGREFLVAIPVALVACWAGWSLGPAAERLLFGGDFRAWWVDTTGLAYVQRNSLVVGVMMGFAVIPIIYTIAEDAMSNVPRALRSGSLAMGASRWQTALRIVLPTAAAGIFSAVMIGFGRAIGETMIVVMATGNTGVIGWDQLNIFNGLRSLSANIAVEIPEAPQGGTLYRVLFLSAALLFALTFVINTVAELLRQHLRDKYKTV